MRAALAGCLLSAMLLLPAPARAIEIIGDLDALLAKGQEVIFAINPKNGNVAFLPRAGRYHSEAATMIGAGGSIKNYVPGTIKLDPATGQVRMDILSGTAAEKFPAWDNPNRVNRWLGELAANPSSRPLVNAGSISDLQVSVNGEQPVQVSRIRDVQDALSKPLARRPGSPGGDNSGGTSDDGAAGTTDDGNTGPAGDDKPSGTASEDGPGTTPSEDGPTKVTEDGPGTTPSEDGPTQVTEDGPGTTPSEDGPNKPSAENKPASTPTEDGPGRSASSGGQGGRTNAPGGQGPGQSGGGQSQGPGRVAGLPPSEGPGPFGGQKPASGGGGGRGTPPAAGEPPATPNAGGAGGTAKQIGTGAAVGAAAGGAITFVACMLMPEATVSKCLKAAGQSIPEAGFWGAVAATGPVGAAIAAGVGAWEGSKAIGELGTELINFGEARSQEEEAIANRNAQQLGPQRAISDAIAKCDYRQAQIIARQLQGQVPQPAWLPTILPGIEKGALAQTQTEPLLQQVRSTPDRRIRADLLEQAAKAANGVPCLMAKVTEERDATTLSGPQEPTCIYVLGLSGGSVYLGRPSDIKRSACSFGGGGPCSGAGLNPPEVKHKGACFPNPSDAKAAWCQELKGKKLTNWPVAHDSTAPVYGGDYWVGLAPACPAEPATAAAPPSSPGLYSRVMPLEDPTLPPPAAPVPPPIGAMAKISPLGSSLPPTHTGGEDCGSLFQASLNADADVTHYSQLIRTIDQESKQVKQIYDRVVDDLSACIAKYGIDHDAGQAVFTPQWTEDCKKIGLAVNRYLRAWKTLGQRGMEALEGLRTARQARDNLDAQYNACKGRNPDPDPAKTPPTISTGLDPALIPPPPPPAPPPAGMGRTCYYKSGAQSWTVTIYDGNECPHIPGATSSGWTPAGPPPDMRQDPKPPSGGTHVAGLTPSGPGGLIPGLLGSPLPPVAPMGTPGGAGGSAGAGTNCHYHGGISFTVYGGQTCPPVNGQPPISTSAAPPPPPMLQDPNALPGGGAPGTAPSAAVTPAATAPACPPLTRSPRKCPWTPNGFTVGECTPGFCWDGGPQGSLACKQEKDVPNSKRTYTTDIECAPGHTAKRDPCTGVIQACESQQAATPPVAPSSALKNVVLPAPPLQQFVPGPPTALGGTPVIGLGSSVITPAAPDHTPKVTQKKKAKQKKKPTAPVHRQGPSPSQQAQQDAANQAAAAAAAIAIIGGAAAIAAGSRSGRGGGHRRAAPIGGHHR